MRSKKYFPCHKRVENISLNLLSLTQGFVLVWLDLIFQVSVDVSLMSTLLQNLPKSFTSLISKSYAYNLQLKWIRDCLAIYRSAREGEASDESEWTHETFNLKAGQNSNELWMRFNFFNLKNCNQRAFCNHYRAWSKSEKNSNSNHFIPLALSNCNLIWFIFLCSSMHLLHMKSEGIAWDN